MLPCVIYSSGVFVYFTTVTYNIAQQQQAFNGLFSRTTWVSRYQKGKSNLDFTGARESEWQWHQLGYMQVCTSFQTDNHSSTPPLCFFTGRMPFLPPNQQCQSTHVFDFKLGMYCAVLRFARLQLCAILLTCLRELEWIHADSS